LRVEDSADWRPTANANTLQQRAEIIRRLREWFYQQNILEVETPQLSKAYICRVSFKKTACRWIP